MSILEYSVVAPEDRHRELKLFSAVNLKTLARHVDTYLPAFANSEGGELLLGVSDEGELLSYHSIIVLYSDITTFGYRCDNFQTPDIFSRSI